MEKELHVYYLLCQYTEIVIPKAFTPKIGKAKYHKLILVLTL